jgi:hypothetical protein
LVWDGWNGVPQGDPALAWVPPIEQNVARTTIAAFMPQIANPRIVNHYVLIVTPTATKASTKVNGGNLSGGTWMDHALSGYSVYNMKLTQATSYTYENPTGLFLIGYGYGSYES